MFNEDEAVAGAEGEEAVEEVESTDEAADDSAGSEEAGVAEAAPESEPEAV
jgi:hypothetical protein